MGSLVGLCVLTLVLGSAKTEVQNKEFLLGGTLTLKPAALTSSISSITWKHEGNLLAEQFNSEPLYYGQFKNRTRLNFKTGELSISPLTEKDDGKYDVEINNVILDVGYQVKIIKPVPVPSVLVQPLACSETSTQCSLDCHGDVTDAGTVRYSWKEGDKDWKESQRKKDIKNDPDTQTIKEFFCKVSNSGSEKESPAMKNPFYKEQTGSNAAVVAGIVIGVILPLIAGAVGFYLFKRGLFTKCVQKTGRTKGTPGEIEAMNKLENPPTTGADSVSSSELAKSDPTRNPGSEPATKDDTAPTAVNVDQSADK